MLYALGFIGLFTIGGLTGLFLAALAARRAPARHLFRGRAFPLHHGRRHGHRHSSAACISGGRRSPAGCIRRCGAALAALLIFLGFNLTFFPQFILGYLGMPRRYHAYPPEFQVLNVLSSAGASILAVGLSAAAGLSDLVAVLGRKGAGESVERDRPRMADPVAAAAEEFRRHAGGDRGTVLLPAARDRAAQCLRLRVARIPILERRASGGTAISGMWLFLATELLFFGALFLSWLFCRHWNQPGFDAGARETELAIGTINTAILVTSSFTYSLGLAFAEAGNNRRSDPMLRRDPRPWTGLSGAEVRPRMARRH